MELAWQRAKARRLQSRLDAMYVDKLDGRVSAEFYDRKACAFSNSHAGRIWLSKSSLRSKSAVC